MKRWLGILLRILCLLIFLLSIALWVRSYFMGELLTHISTRTDSTQQPFVSQRLSYSGLIVFGKLGIARGRLKFRGTNSIQAGWYHERWKPTGTGGSGYFYVGDPDWRFGKFQLTHAFSEFKGGWISEQGLTVPLWIFLPAGLPPLLWLLHRRHEKARGFAANVASPAGLTHVGP